MILQILLLIYKLLCFVKPVLISPIIMYSSFSSQRLFNRLNTNLFISCLKNLRLIIIPILFWLEYLQISNILRFISNLHYRDFLLHPFLLLFLFINLTKILFALSEHFLSLIFEQVKFQLIVLRTFNFLHFEFSVFDFIAILI